MPEELTEECAWFDMGCDEDDGRQYDTACGEVVNVKPEDKFPEDCPHCGRPVMVA